MACFLLIAWKILHLPIELGEKPIVLGHGGMGVASALPLNSLISIESALSFPIQGTELDVRMTSDEVLLAFHDEDLSMHTDCNGLVSETNLKDLRDCLNSTWRKNEPIVQLDHILSQDWKPGTLFSLDLKTESKMQPKRSTVFAESIVELVSDHKAFRFLIESENMELLKNLKLHGINVELFYYAKNWNQDFSLALKNGLDGISINMDLISQQDLAQAKSKDMKVMLWGTGSVWSNRAALKMGADIIQTDDVSSMVCLMGLE